MNDKNKQYKLQISFDAPAVTTLEVLRQATSPTATVADVVRDALGFYEWARRRKVQGFTVGAVQNGVLVSEVDLPFQSIELDMSKALD